MLNLLLEFGFNKFSAKFSQKKCLLCKSSGPAYIYTVMNMAGGLALPREVWLQFPK